MRISDWSSDVCSSDLTGSAVPSLRRILVGGAPMPPALMERLEQQLGVTVQTSWGMTELSPLGTAASPADTERDAPLSGRPAVGVDLLPTDSDGRPLPEQHGFAGPLKTGSTPWEGKGGH